MPKKSARLIISRPAALLVILVALNLAVAIAFCGEQSVIPRVQRMPRLPEPMIVRDWPQVAKQYYKLLLNPATRLDGKPLVVVDTGSKQFKIPPFVGHKPNEEAFTCLAPLIGAKLVGLDPADLYGFNYVQVAKNWYDPNYGI